MQNNFGLEIITNLYLILNTLLFLLTIILLIKIFQKYDLGVAIKFLFIAGGLNFRSLSIYIIFLSSIFPVFDQYWLNIIRHLLLMIFFFVLAYFSSSLKIIFRNHRMLSLINISSLIFSLLGFLAFFDLLLPENIYFNVITNDLGFYLPVTDNGVALLRIIGNFILLSIFLFIYLNSKFKQSLFISWDHAKSLVITMVMIFISFDLAIVTDNLLSFSTATIFLVSLIHMSISLAISFLIMILLINNINNTYFNTFFGKDINLAINDGIIGFILTSFTKYGPEALVTSQEFKNHYKLTDITIMGLSVNAISNVGSFRDDPSDSFKETISLVPVPNNSHLFALNITFNTKDPELTMIDSRFETGVPSALTIIFPSDLLLELKKLYDILPQVISEVKQDDRLDRFKNPLFLRRMSLEIIKEMIY